MLIYDAPSELDIQYSDVVLASKPKEKVSFPKDRLKVWDQGISNGCSMYAATHINNAQNILDTPDKEQKDPAILWGQMFNLFPNIEKEGTSMQSVITWNRKRGNIVGYAVVSTKEQVMRAIDYGHYIYSGSRDCDRKTTGETKEYTRGDFDVCHAFVGGFAYNDFGCLGLNSWGAGWGDGGYFWISWDNLLNHTRTKYAIIDKDDDKALLRARLSAKQKQLKDLQDWMAETALILNK